MAVPLVNNNNGDATAVMLLFMNQSDFQLIDFTSKVARETDLCYVS